MLYNIVKAPIHSFPPPFAEQSPASPKVPLPAKSPVLKLFRDSGQSWQRHPGNSSCHAWHCSVHHERRQSVHMKDSHMIVSKRLCPSQPFFSSPVPSLVETSTR